MQGSRIRRQDKNLKWFLLYLPWEESRESGGVYTEAVILMLRQAQHSKNDIGSMGFLTCRFNGSTSSP